MKNKIALSLVLIAFVSTMGCSQNDKKPVATVPVNDTKEKKDELSASEKLFVGTWRIDSVAENQQVIDRLIHDDTIQAFRFEINRKLISTEITPKMEFGKPIGKWKIELNRLLMLNDSERVFTEYIYEFRGPVLILSGTTPISSKNPRKPVFYLTRYVSESSKKIMGN